MVVMYLLIWNHTKPCMAMKYMAKHAQPCSNLSWSPSNVLVPWYVCVSDFACVSVTLHACAFACLTESVCIRVSECAKPCKLHTNTTNHTYIHTRTHTHISSIQPFLPKLWSELQGLSRPLTFGNVWHFWVFGCLLCKLPVAVQQIDVTADPSCHCQFSTALWNGKIESDYILHRNEKGLSCGKARKQNKRCWSDGSLKVSDRPEKRKMSDHKNIRDHKFITVVNTIMLYNVCPQVGWQFWISSHTGAACIYWCIPLWDLTLRHSGASAAKQPQESYWLLRYEIPYRCLHQYSPAQILYQHIA